MEYNLKDKYILQLNEKEKALETRDLNIFYGEKQALFDGNLQFERYKITSLIGASGSGKSTFLRSLNRMNEGVADVKGSILYRGIDINSPKINVYEMRKYIGMVFQNPDNQFVGATVEDDVAFGLENQGMDHETMVNRVNEALEIVGMQDFKNREPARLSGGQKQRVAIAGIVALRPDIIILDEATSMLDPEGRLDLIQTVKRIKDENQMTVISITHDLDEVALSDRVLVMKKGKVESSSTARELFSRSDLQELGLDEPFSNQVKATLNEDFDLPADYLTEKELQESLWELL